MSFDNDRYSMDKDPYEWCLRQSKRPKAIDLQINIQMRNHKLLTQIPGELEHEVKFTCNQNCTLDKPRERVAEVDKKKNSCHNCGSTDHYANTFPKAKKKVYAIEKVPEEESPTEDSESYSMVEYQEETPLEIQDIWLEAGIPWDTATKNLFKKAQDAQTFLVTPTKGMAYIYGTAKKMTVCINNTQQTLIIDSGEHFSIVARNSLYKHFPNWDKQLLPTKEKNFKNASQKMKYIGKIIKEIIIPHSKGGIRLNPEFVVLEDPHIQGILLGTDYQRMYGIDIYNSKSGRITIGTNKEQDFHLTYTKYLPMNLS
ncbi:hypothetical protein O181_033893 [Austropuccinia psidii MF-1]|uniref:Uncharacterized protein n=1 Tax=Austropuccinia psidii MF-1 TaxID=1389203 RepID=A0A9Q3D2D7_9BASI|nr:hypothetical protein [Austropuccinia psidii MF-1]